MERLLNESSRKVSDIRETRRPGIQRRRLPVHGIRFEDRCWKGIIVRTNMLCPCATPAQVANYWNTKKIQRRKRERAAELASIRALNKVSDIPETRRSGILQHRRLIGHDDIPEALTRRAMSGPDGDKRKKELHDRWAKRIREKRGAELEEELAKIAALKLATNLDRENTMYT